MIVFLHLFAATVSYVPIILYYFIRDHDLRWYSRLFCENITILLLSLIIWFSRKENPASKGYLRRKFDNLIFEFWVIKLILSQFDILLAHNHVNFIYIADKKILIEDMIIFSTSALLVYVISKSIFIGVSFIRKYRK
jgi:hypothetical protein